MNDKRYEKIIIFDAHVCTTKMQDKQKQNVYNSCYSHLALNRLESTLTGSMYYFFVSLHISFSLILAFVTLLHFGKHFSRKIRKRILFLFVSSVRFGSNNACVEQKWNERDKLMKNRNDAVSL